MKRSTRVALTACVALGAIAPASANHSWGGYHWATTTRQSLTLDVLTSNTSYWETAIATAISDWDNPVVGGAIDVLTLNRTASSANPKRCTPVKGKVLVCNYKYGQRGWLGIASIWLSNGHISQATTKLNDSYYQPGSRYNTAAWRALVACQEIGHDFGLDHQDENFNNGNLDTCMDYTNLPESNQHPNAHDYEELGIIYDHPDSFDSAILGAAATNFGVREIGKPAVTGSDAGIGDTMSEWGRAIGLDGKGRPDTFLRQLPDGRKVLTHVFWTLEAKGTEARE
jgi:hypothetical protein